MSRHVASILLELRVTSNLDQSAVTTSTQRILSARSISYRRAPRVKPVDLDLSEECERISGTLSDIQLFITGFVFHLI